MLKKYQGRTVGQSISWAKFNYSYFCNQSLASYLDEGFLEDNQNNKFQGENRTLPPPAQPDPPGKKGRGPSLPRPLKAVTPRSQQSSPALSPGSLCVQSASSSNFVPVGYKRIFCLQICTFSPFFKDGFKPRCLRGKKKRWNWIYSQRNPKNTVWGQMQ